MVAAQEKVLGKYDTNLAASYHHLSIIYNKMGNLPLALEYQQKTVVIFEKVLDKDHPDLASSYNNLSVIYYKIGDIEQAAVYIDKTLHIWQHCLPNDHPSLVIALKSKKLIKFTQLLQAQDMQSIMADEEMKELFIDMEEKNKK